jgi:hypothetical protein
METLEDYVREPSRVLVDNFIEDVSSPKREFIPEKPKPKKEPTIIQATNRAPPTGPIPTSLLQAAETNAMRLSKAQYEFLKGGKVNKKAIRNAKAASKLLNKNYNADTSDNGESEGNNDVDERNQNYNSDMDESAMINSTAVRVKKIPPSLIRKESNNNNNEVMTSSSSIRGQNTNNNTAEFMKPFGSNKVVAPVSSISGSDAIEMV